MKRIIILSLFSFLCLSLFSQGIKPLDDIRVPTSKSFTLVNENANGDFTYQYTSTEDPFIESVDTFLLYTLNEENDVVSVASVPTRYDVSHYFEDDSYLVIDVKDRPGAARYSASDELMWETEFYDFENRNNSIGLKTESSVFATENNVAADGLVFDDGILFFGSTASDVSSTTGRPYMFKINMQGEIVWDVLLDVEGEFDLLNFCKDFSDGLKLVGDPIPQNFSFVGGDREIEVDLNGNIISNIPFVEYELVNSAYVNGTTLTLGYERVSKVILLDDGDELVISEIRADSATSPISSRTFFFDVLVKYDSDTREAIWHKRLGGTNTEPDSRILKHTDNEYIIFPRTSNSIAHIVNTDTGEYTKSVELNTDGTSVFIENVFKREDHYMCVGLAADFFRQEKNLVFFKVDNDLNVFDIQSNTLPIRTLINTDGFSVPFVSAEFEISVDVLPSGDYVGALGIFSGLDNNNFYVFNADSDGVILANKVQGKAIGDFDFTCTETPGDINLEGWTVSAKGPVVDFQTLTDENGNYTLQLDSGSYDISLIPLNDFWLNCDTLEQDFNALFDSTSFDFVATAIELCSFIEVDIGFSHLRRCYSNRVTVQYCNQGTLIEDNAMVDLILDADLDVDSTSIPIANQSGDTLYFDIGTLDIGECGKFTIFVTPNCNDAYLGQEHCINAHVFPDTLCVPQDSLWSGANVVVEAICMGDSTIFTIFNNGTAPTVDDLTFLIIVDDIIVSRTDEFSLGIGESIQFVESEPGSTFTVVVDQEPNHPLGDQVVLEAFCAGSDFDFISEFNQFDNDPFTDLVCVDNIGSFDPNDKTAIPIGQGPEHFINADQELEYKIRFQNTGTDTAFTVIIRDTISNLLDMSTLQAGVGSHNYNLAVEEENILVFTFNGILLPDSTVNWAASNGFVEFKISPIGTVVPDDRIENTAAISFDFNEPVITNTTFHTIETPLVFSIVEVQTCPNIPYNDMFFNADTILSEFFFGEFRDSIAIVKVNIGFPDGPEIPYNGIDDDCDASTLDDDLDQDGFVLAEDCDDTNADINSAQEEIPFNGIDDDCDASTLDDDLDQDGFASSEDCDDTNPDINSGQEEIPYNGIDDDCDASTLDDDLDQDGFVLSEDCDDTNADINSAQAEVPYNGIDDDCDASTLDDDLDQDGFVLSEDCDDTDANINSGQAEVPYNGIDDDCDALTLDDDLDQDGFVLAEDCDDTNSSINPDVEEIPNNGIDEDCDGVDLLTSVHEIKDVIVKIYPNPAIDIVNIDVSGSLDYEITVYSITGKVLIQAINDPHIQLGYLPQGTYLLEIKGLDSNQKIVERIVKGM